VGYIVNCGFRGQYCCYFEGAWVIKVRKLFVQGVGCNLVEFHLGKLSHFMCMYLQHFHMGLGI